MNKEYQELHAKLQVPSEDPEGLQALRDLIESVPKFVLEQGFALEDTYPYYHALSEMQRNLSDEDNKLKAAVQYWPTKLNHEIKVTEAAMSQDQTRTRRNRRRRRRSS